MAGPRSTALHSGDRQRSHQLHVLLHLLPGESACRLQPRPPGRTAGSTTRGTPTRYPPFSLDRRLLRHERRGARSVCTFLGGIPECRRRWYAGTCLVLQPLRKKLRAKTTVNRRNLLRKDHKLYRVHVLQYLRPRVAYWKAHREELYQQKMSLHAVGRSVLDRTIQPPYPSEDELTEVESDGGTRKKVRRVVDRRVRRPGPPRPAVARRLRPRTTPAAPVPGEEDPAIPTAGDIPEASHPPGTRPSAPRRPRPRPAPVGEPPVRTVPTSAVPPGGMQNSTYQGQPGWTMHSLRTCTYHRFDRPQPTAVFTSVMRDHFALLNAVATRHMLWTWYGALMVNALYSSQEHLVLDTFIRRNFRMPEPAATATGRTAEGETAGPRPPSPPPPAAPGASGGGQ